MGGPIWSAPIHDQEWVASILADVKSMKERYPAYDRICAVLTAISEVWFAYNWYYAHFTSDLSSYQLALGTLSNFLFFFSFLKKKFAGNWTTLFHFM